MRSQERPIWAKHTSRPEINQVYSKTWYVELRRWSFFTGWCPRRQQWYIISFLVQTEELVSVLVDQRHKHETLARTTTPEENISHTNSHRQQAQAEYETHEHTLVQSWAKAVHDTLQTATLLRCHCVAVLNCACANIFATWSLLRCSWICALVAQDVSSYYFRKKATEKHGIILPKVDGEELASEVVACVNARVLERGRQNLSRSWAEVSQSRERRHSILTRRQETAMTSMQRFTD